MIPYNETYRALQTFKDLLEPNKKVRRLNSYSVGEPKSVLLRGISSHSDIEAVLLAPPQIRRHSIGLIASQCKPPFSNFDIYDFDFSNEQHFKESGKNPSFAFVMMRPERECPEKGYSHPRILFARLIGSMKNTDSPMQVLGLERNPRTGNSCSVVYARAGDHYTHSLDIDPSLKYKIANIQELFELLVKKGLEVPREVFHSFRFHKNPESSDSRFDKSISTRTYPKHPTVSKHKYDPQMFDKLNEK